jgi:hypothetical protein
MEQLQFIGITPELQKNQIIKGVAILLKDFEKNFQPKQPKMYLSRLEVSKMLNVSLVTLNKWNKSGRLKAVGIGGRVLYLQETIDKSIVEL